MAARHGSGHRCALYICTVVGDTASVRGCSFHESRRRAVQDDNRGVAEPLNETVCGCRDCDCPGLIARGTLQLLLAPTSPDTHSSLRKLQALSAEPPLPLFGRGRDIVRWLTASMRDAATSEVVVSAGSVVEDVGVAARPGWDRGAAGAASNASHLWPVGASGLLESHPLAKAVLKKLGDNGVIRIETSAAGYPPGVAQRPWYISHTTRKFLAWIT